MSAPAGWGKTTILREWAAAAPASGWVSLDEADNDPVRFWNYVIEALRSAGAAVGTAPALAAADHAGLTALLNELDGLADPVSLAIDDMHLVTATQVHDGLAFLVDHLPGTVRLAVATRVDPPLGLARMRARGELVEVRADDLRFSDDEAAALLRATTGAPLGDDAVRRLRTRTEGWAAGLYLAGLSLRGRADATAFVDAFAGDDRLVVDYLADEVLTAQPEDRRRFLLETSILTRLSAPLCDAVTGRDDAARILTELEGSNLFLVPLDTRRRWYRFHHLFGELLRHELAADAPERVAGLHRRAAGWFAADGAVDDAVHHLVAAGDLAAAADLVATSWSRYHDRGWVATVLRWVSLLPGEMVRADPRLCLANAWAAITLGRQEDIAGWVDAAESALGNATPPPALAASIAMARSLEHLLHGRSELALAAGERALALETDPASQWRAVACLAVAMASYQDDHTERAYEMFAEAVAVGERTGISIAPLLSLGHMVEVDLAAGDIDRAAGHAARALALADAEDHSHFPHAACAHTAIAQVHAARGRLDDALAEADRAVELATRGRAGLEIGHALLVRADIRAAAGMRSDARADVDRAREAMSGPDRRVPTRLATRLAQMGDRLRTPAPAGPGDELTGRELVVLRLLAGPASLREIAGELVVSPNTVKSQVRAIYRKLDVDRRSRAVEAARERGLLGG